MTISNPTKPIPRRRTRKTSETVVSQPAVIMVAPSTLHPYANNAREHSPKQIGQIQNSIRAFGFMNPILIGNHNEVIAGHGRLAAATELGLTQVPVIQVMHLSETEVRAYRLADNKLAENATWDAELLQMALLHKSVEGCSSPFPGRT